MNINFIYLYFHTFGSMVEKRGEEASSGAINKLILKKAANRRTSQILSKAFISEKEVYNLIRGFFKKYLEIDYEFTHKELLKELKRVYLTPDLQKKVNSMFNKISSIEHSSKPFPRDDLENLLIDFNEIVEELIISHYVKNKSFMNKLRDSIHELFSKEHNTMLEVNESVLSENERIIVKMNMLLDNSKRWSDKDIKKSKEAYKELLELYNSLDEDRKKAYFKPVQELYNMIKSAE